MIYFRFEMKNSLLKFVHKVLISPVYHEVWIPFLHSMLLKHLQLEQQFLTALLHKKYYVYCSLYWINATQNYIPKENFI